MAVSHHSPGTETPVSGLSMQTQTHTHACSDVKPQATLGIRGIAIISLSTLKALLCILVKAELCGCAVCYHGAHLGGGGAW